MSLPQLPDGWERVAVGDLGFVYGGLSGKSAADFGRGEARYITFLDVINNARVDGRNAQAVRVGAHESQNRVQEGDVLFNGTSETPDELALAAVVTDEIPNLYLNSFCFGLRPYDRTRLEPLFLAYLFRSRVGRELMVALAQGSTRYNLSKKQFSRLVLPLPDLAEQRRIAQALRDVEDLIESLERVITKKRGIRSGIETALLTGDIRIPGHSSRWVARTLDEVAAVVMGQSPPGKFYNTSRVGLPLVQGKSDIQDRETSVRMWSEQGAKQCRRGDIIMTVRAPVGAVARASGDAYLGRGVCAIRVNESTSADFVYHALRHAESRWSSAEQGTTFTAANGNHVRSFEIEMPSDIDEQRAIAEVLNDTDSEFAVLRQRLEKTRQVKRGMMQELLTGRTRLPAKGAAA